MISRKRSLDLRILFHLRKKIGIMCELRENKQIKTETVQSFSLLTENMRQLTDYFYCVILFPFRVFSTLYEFIKNLQIKTEILLYNF